jgi:hypothetical protein
LQEEHLLAYSSEPQTGSISSFHHDQGRASEIETTRTHLPHSCIETRRRQSSTGAIRTRDCPSCTGICRERRIRGWSPLVRTSAERQSSRTQPSKGMSFLSLSLHSIIIALDSKKYQCHYCPPAHKPLQTKLILAVSSRAHLYAPAHDVRGESVAARFGAESA